MNRLLRTGIVAVASGLLITAVGHGAAWADGNDHGDVSIEGRGSSFGSFSFHASAARRDPESARGYFTGESPAGPFITLKGRITCLSVHGNRAGFIYRLSGGSMPALLTGQEVKVSIEDNGGHGRDKIGFGLAAPAGTYRGCAPDTMTASPVHSGHTSVHGNHHDD